MCVNMSVVAGGRPQIRAKPGQKFGQNNEKFAQKSKKKINTRQRKQKIAQRVYPGLFDFDFDYLCVQFRLFRPVFFNLFAAAEPHTNVEVTHGTPGIDPCVQRRTRGRSYRVSTDSFS